MQATEVDIRGETTDIQMHAPYEAMTTYREFNRKLNAYTGPCFALWKTPETANIYVRNYLNKDVNIMAWLYNIRDGISEELDMGQVDRSKERKSSFCCYSTDCQRHGISA